MTRTVRCAISVFVTLMCAGAVLAAPIKHGREIEAANTGPAAAGYRDLQPADGGEIKDGRTYAFARAVAQTAIYDGYEVKGPHLLIEGVAFTRPLDIAISQPLVMRGVSVRVAPDAPWTILIRPQAGPVYLLWSDAGGALVDQSADGTSKATPSALQLRGDNATVFRSHLSHTGDGIDVSGQHVNISETLIDDLATFQGSHNDGIQLAETAADVQIARAKIKNANPQTSCIYVLGDGVTITDSYVAGGGWTLYGGAKNNGHGGKGASHVAVKGTIFGREFSHKSGHFGSVTYWDRDHALGNIWSGNSFDDGRPIAP